MIGRARLHPGTFTGIVKERSGSEPARDHTYTIGIQLPNGSEVVFEGVAPDPRKRLSRQDDTLELVPFELGETVVVHVLGTTSNMTAIIGEGEQPHLGPCTQGGTP
jgi:hypothetical protein